MPFEKYAATPVGISAASDRFCQKKRENRSFARIERSRFMLRCHESPASKRRTLRKPILCKLRIARTKYSLRGRQRTTIAFCPRVSKPMHRMSRACGSIMNWRADARYLAVMPDVRARLPAAQLRAADAERSMSTAACLKSIGDRSSGHKWGATYTSTLPSSSPRSHHLARYQQRDGMQTPRDRSLGGVDRAGEAGLQNKNARRTHFGGDEDGGVPPIAPSIR